MISPARALVFLNPGSGGAARRVGPALSGLREVVKIPSVHVDLEPDQVQEAVATAMEEGIELVIAVGGDGTVGTVIDGIAGKGMTLAVVPVGTSNNFARCLGLRPTVRAAIEALRGGRTDEVDIGMANGHHFGHAAILGLNVDFAREAQRLRARIGRLSYPAASLMVYAHKRRHEISVRAGDTNRNFSAYQLAVMACGLLGGPLELEASPDDPPGRLILATVQDLELMAVLRDLPELFFRRHLGLPGSTTMNVEEAIIETSAPVPVTLDGEVRTETPLSVRVVKKGLTVIVPPRGKDRG